MAVMTALMLLGGSMKPSCQFCPIDELLLRHLQLGLWHLQLGLRHLQLGLWHLQLFFIADFMTAFMQRFV